MVLLASALNGGCGGYYILTVPDHIAPSGGEAVVVSRLQRNDFFVLSVPVSDAAIRFRLGGEQLRGAYTDETGYAGTVLEAPDEPGAYRLNVAHMDPEGEEVQAWAPLYAVSPDRDVIVVDKDCLPTGRDEEVYDAARAISHLARKSSILYLTRTPVKEHRQAHQELQALGYPDGPILPWRRKRWHIVRSGRFNLPRVVFESHLESQLSTLRGMFDGLNVGLCGSPIAARAFADAGMRTIFVGKEEVDVPNLTRRISWSEFAAAGL